MKSVVATVSALRPVIRRSLIMIMDVVMVLIAIPLSLLLSNSYLSIDPYSAYGIALWLAVGVYAHAVFRISGVYAMMWRFASTPDFFNIFRNCGILVVSLYALVYAIRYYFPVTGLNERQFIVLFLMTFVFISSPRLIYRYLREGPGWNFLDRNRGRPGEKRALFLGGLDEADIIISFSRSSIVRSMSIVGIVSPDTAGSVGARIQGVPLVGDHLQAREVLYEYLKDTESLEMLIFGKGADKDFEDFPELVRIARQHGLAVEQFTGLSDMRRSGKLVLEKVEMETILRRSTVKTDVAQLASFLAGKKVLVTGGAGSIGRTLVKRALSLDAAAVLVADLSEFNVFQLQSEHERERDEGRLILRILDICDRTLLASAVRDFAPDIIFHAAALKHVPLLEDNWISAIKTNVYGTRNCVEVAAEFGVPHFVLVSSDKAADPTSVLGLTKRVAEQMVNAMHFAQAERSGTFSGNANFIGVRFGNVFGSDGSVSTVFQKQIAAGGPVTITDPAMTRYFMTIGEAVDLVMMSAAVSSVKKPENGHGIYMLDMGKPVSIMAVADIMIRLAGKKPNQDIPIVVTGRRPGEKLHEVLSAPGEEIINIGVPSIFGLRTGVFRWNEVETTLDALLESVARCDRDAAIALMKDLFRPASQTVHFPAGAKPSRRRIERTVPGDGAPVPAEAETIGAPLVIANETLLAGGKTSASVYDARLKGDDRIARPAEFGTHAARSGVDPIRHP